MSMGLKQFSSLGKKKKWAVWLHRQWQRPSRLSLRRPTQRLGPPCVVSAPTERIKNNLLPFCSRHPHSTLHAWGRHECLIPVVWGWGKVNLGRGAGWTAALGKRAPWWPCLEAHRAPGQGSRFVGRAVSLPCSGPPASPSGWVPARLPTLVPPPPPPPRVTQSPLGSETGNCALTGLCHVRVCVCAHAHTQLHQFAHAHVRAHASHLHTLAPAPQVCICTLASQGRLGCEEEEEFAHPAVPAWWSSQWQCHPGDRPGQLRQLGALRQEARKAGVESAEYRGCVSLSASGRKETGSPAGPRCPQLGRGREQQA